MALVIRITYSTKKIFLHRYDPELPLFGLSPPLGLSYQGHSFIKTEKRAHIVGYMIMLTSTTIAAICNLVLFDSSMPPVYYMMYPPFEFFRGMYMITGDYASPEKLRGTSFLIIMLYLVGENILTYALGARIGWRRPFSQTLDS